MAKSPEEQLQERNKKINDIRNTFADARAYLNAKGYEGDKNIPYHDTDLRWEAIIPVLKREIPVFVHADEIREIQAAVNWASDENIKMVLIGGYDSWRVKVRYITVLKRKELSIELTAPFFDWNPLAISTGAIRPFTLIGVRQTFCLVKRTAQRIVITTIVVRAIVVRA